METKPFILNRYVNTIITDTRTKVAKIPASYQLLYPSAKVTLKIQGFEGTIFFAGKSEITVLVKMPHNGILFSIPSEDEVMLANLIFFLTNWLNKEFPINFAKI